MGNASAVPPKRTTVAFRTDIPTRLRLEAIQHEKGHDQLSDTLREAVGEYIERHAHAAAA